MTINCTIFGIHFIGEPVTEEAAKEMLIDAVDFMGKKREDFVRRVLDGPFTFNAMNVENGKASFKFIPSLNN